MGPQSNLFREEDLILNHMDQVGRLDKSRELYRLVNMLNNVLVEHSTLPPESVEKVYDDLKRRLEREYYKTEVVDLDTTEMKVWHLSMFSSIELLQKLLVNGRILEPEMIQVRFRQILDDHFEDQLQQFSEKYDVGDLNERLPDPEIFLQDDMELLYWVNRGHEIHEFTEVKKKQEWQTESVSEPREVEVKL